MCTEEHARSVLEPHAEGLVNVIDGGWKQYVAEGIPRKNPTTRAGIVNDHMHELMPVHVPAAVHAASPRAMKPFYVVDDITLRVKYLGKRLAPSNVPTGAQTKIAGQLVLDGVELHGPDVPEQLVLDGLEAAEPTVPKPPYVSVGYSLDPTESEIERIMAVMYEGHSMCWAIDLRKLAAAAGGEPMPVEVLPVAPVAPALPAIVAKADVAAVEQADAAPSPKIAAATAADETAAAESAGLAESS